MKVWQMKKYLESFDDDLEIFVKVSNSVGTISEVETIKIDQYGFFGTLLDCLLIGFESECESECDNCEIYCTSNDDLKYRK
jgi:hypothetical protein